jgi:hypothetical protein
MPLTPDHDEMPEPWELRPSLTGSITTRDVDAMTDADWVAWRKELRAAEARKIPLGFPIPELCDD